MTFLGIGPLELVLILVLALVMVGPEGMVTTAYKIGRWLNKVVHSPLWQDMVKTSQEIQNLPRQIMRETGLEQDVKEIRDLSRSVNEPILPSESRVGRQFPETQVKQEGDSEVKPGQVE